MRIRESAFSTTRAPILSRRFLRVANSAHRELASTNCRGTASPRSGESSASTAAVLQDEAELKLRRAGSGRRSGRTDELDLVQLDEVNLGLVAERQ